MAQQIQTQVPNGGHVRGRMALADTAFVFATDDIEPPVQAIFYPPVSANRLRKPMGIGRNRIDEVALFNAPGVALPTFAFYYSFPSFFVAIF